MFQIANALLGIYLIWRCVVPLPMSRWGKVLGGALVLAFIEHHWLVSKLFNTSIPSPELPRLVLMALALAYGALLILALGFAVKDLIALALLAFRRPVGRRLLRSRRATASLALVSLGLSFWGVWEAVRVPSVRELSITVPGLPPRMDGYRLVLLTDLHASRLFQQPWVEEVVQLTNDLRPNLIVISGDLVDGTTEARMNDVSPLSGFVAPDGVFAVAGNHEYYADYEQWMTTFHGLGISMLENSFVHIQPNRGGLILAGVPDEVAPSRQQVGPDVAQALAGKPEGLPVILLDHRPGHMRANQKLGVDLQLSGHTHGGHIRGVDMIVGLFNDGFVSGLYHVNGASLYVSNGAGLWPGFATRVGRPSEITHITLRAPVVHGVERID